MKFSTSQGRIEQLGVSIVYRPVCIRSVYKEEDHEIIVSYTCIYLSAGLLVTLGHLLAKYDHSRETISYLESAFDHEGLEVFT